MASVGVPAPITARDKMLADTLRQLELLRAEEERTVVELRGDKAAMKELESEYLATVDAVRYTDGRPFEAAGTAQPTAPWEKSALAEGTIEDIERRFAEREAQARREKDRLKRFVDKRADLLARLTVQSRHLLSEADWAAAAVFLESSGHSPAKAGGIDFAVASLQHHPVHAEGLLQAIMRVHPASFMHSSAAAATGIAAK
jgi:hypothetical protein